VKPITDLILFFLQAILYTLSIVLGAICFLGAIFVFAFSSILVAGWEWVVSKMKNAH